MPYRVRRGPYGSRLPGRKPRGPGRTVLAAVFRAAAADSVPPVAAIAAAEDVSRMARPTPSVSSTLRPNRVLVTGLPSLFSRSCLSNDRPPRSGTGAHVPTASGWCRLPAPPWRSGRPSWPWPTRYSSRVRPAGGLRQEAWPVVSSLVFQAILVKAPFGPESSPLGEWGMGWWSPGLEGRA